MLNDKLLGACRAEEPNTSLAHHCPDDRDKTPGTLTRPSATGHCLYPWPQLLLSPLKQHSSSSNMAAHQSCLVRTPSPLSTLVGLFPTHLGSAFMSLLWKVFLIAQVRDTASLLTYIPSLLSRCQCFYEIPCTWYSV